MNEKMTRESKARRAGWTAPRAKGLRALWRDRDGAAAVEFAFIVPILLLLFSGIVQFGSIMFLENHMTNVARETSRRVAVGELAEAIGELNRGDGDRLALEEEFADVLAWLATLANVMDVDLTEAVARKYVDTGGPKGTK